MAVFYISMIAVVVIVAASIYMVVSTLKDFKNAIPMAKEFSEHIFGENQKTAGRAWNCGKWLVLGALSMFLCAKIFFPVPIPLILSILLQAVIVYLITKKDSQTKSLKRKCYAIGAVASLLDFFFVIMLKIGGSEDIKDIQKYLLIAITIVVTVIFISRKDRILDGLETRRTQGTITRIVESSQSFLFFKYARIITYEYEFFANGMTYKGIASEPKWMMKKRGNPLESPAKVVYQWNAPEFSRLEALNSNKKIPPFLVMTVALAAFILICVYSTDLVQTIKNFCEEMKNYKTV